MKNIFYILLMFLIIGCCNNDKSSSKDAKVEQVKRDINGYTKDDPVKLQIGARLNFHKVRLLIAEKEYAIYEYGWITDNSCNCRDYYKITIKNNIITKIERIN